MYLLASQGIDWIVKLPLSKARGKPRLLSFVWRADNITQLGSSRNRLRLPDEEFPQLKVRTVVVMQRRPDVRRQACGNCGGRSSSQDRDLGSPRKLDNSKSTAFRGLMRSRSPSRAMPLIVTNRSRDRSNEVQYGPRLFCQSDYRS